MMKTNDRHYNKPPESLSALQKQFAAHIRDPENRPAPGGIEDRRMAIYRELFYNNIEGFLASNFPVIRKLHKTQEWQLLVRDFFVRHQAHTPLFPELPREFLRYLQDLENSDKLPYPFLLELAHYEWVELALSLEQEEIPETYNPDGDLLQEAPVISSLAWPLNYQYPVHQIRPDFLPQGIPEQPTHLMVYRTDEDEIKFMQLNPVAALLAQLLQAEADQPGLHLLQEIAEQTPQTNPEAIMEGGKKLLKSWRQRGIIIGTRSI